MGIFSGMKDDHEGLKMAFGPMFEEYDKITNGEEGYSASSVIRTFGLDCQAETS